LLRQPCTLLFAAILASRRLKPMDCSSNRFAQIRRLRKMSTHTSASGVQSGNCLPPHAHLATAAPTSLAANGLYASRCSVARLVLSRNIESKALRQNVTRDDTGPQRTGAEAPYVATKKWMVAPFRESHRTEDLF
jgi:hypothetical protein